MEKGGSKPISAAQLKKIHAMFTRMGIAPEDKRNIVYSFTGGRTVSTKDLTLEEARILINRLSDYDKETYGKECRKVLSAIYKLSFDIGMSYGETEADRLMNYAKISKFCRERGTVKKNISEMNLHELKQTKKQFEAMFQRNVETCVNKLIDKTFNKKKHEEII